MVRFVSESVEETQQAAELLATVLEPGMVLALEGDLGAGKTHFVQGLAQGLGIAEQVTSPTFTVMCAYEKGRMPLYHFDLYRLEDPTELEDIAFYDYVEAQGVSCIEWARKFEDEIPADALWLSITVETNAARAIEARAQDERGEEALARWQAALDEAR